jgi:hypothetical protein
VLCEPELGIVLGGDGGFDYSRSAIIASLDARGFINKITSSPPSTMSTGTEDLLHNPHDTMTR